MFKSFALILLGILMLSDVMAAGKLPSGFKKICLEGHTYYLGTSIVYKGFMAIKLHSDGTPVKCVVEVSE